MRISDWSSDVCSSDLAFFLRQHIDFGIEISVRRNGAGLRQNLTALHFLTANATDQGADVIAGLTLIKQLAEHFHASDGRLLRRLDTDDFDFFTYFDNASFEAASHNRSEEHTSELPSLMRISSAVFCLTKKNT